MRLIWISLAILSSLSILSLAAVVSFRSAIYCLNSFSMKIKDSASFPTSSRYSMGRCSMPERVVSVEVKSCEGSSLAYSVNFLMG